MKKQPARRSRWLVRLLTVCGIGAMLLLLFVVAFVFNPLEGRLVDVRDIVPREVDFFVRKVALADDLAEFPEPRFWKDFAETSSWTELQSGPMVQSLRRQGVEKSLADARENLSRIRSDSSGFVDLVRDVLGEELLLAGFTEDRSGAAPQPLAQPGGAAMHASPRASARPGACCGGRWCSRNSPTTASPCATRATTA